MKRVIGRNHLRGISLALAAIFLLVSAPVGFSAEDALRLSGWRLPFNLPVMIELERGSYGKAFRGFDVSVVNMRTGPQLMAAMAAGDIDIVQGIGDAAFLVAAASGADAKIIAVNSRSPKAFAVVANKEIKSVADLKGKKVAGIRGSVVHQAFIAALSEYGMTEADVEFFPMPVPLAATALIAGRTDAALLVGGEILRAQKAGAVVIADGDGRVEGLSLVVASGKFISDHPDAARIFLEMRSATLDYIKANPNLATVTASLDTGMSQEDVESMMGWYDFGADLREKDVKSLLATRKYLLDQKLITRDIDAAALVYRDER